MILVLIIVLIILGLLAWSIFWNLTKFRLLESEEILHQFVGEVKTRFSHVSTTYYKGLIVITNYRIYFRGIRIYSKGLGRSGHSLTINNFYKPEYKNYLKGIKRLLSRQNPVIKNENILTIKGKMVIMNIELDSEVEELDELLDNKM